MGTEKKSRAQREEKDNSMASTENSNTSDGSPSLAARRARLRGSLARASISADPFASGAAAAANQYGAQQDPYQQQDPYNQQAQTYTEPETETYQQPEEYQAPANPPEDYNVYGVPMEPEPPAQEVDAFTSSLSGLSDELVAEAPPSPPPQPATTADSFGSAPAPKRRGSKAAAQEPETPAATPDFFASAPAQASVQASTPASVQVAAGQVVIDPSVAEAAQKSVQLLSQIGDASDKTVGFLKESSSTLGNLTVASDKTIDFLHNIDSSLSACATNLAALQNLSTEQSEVLKGLNSTLANQTMLEVGLNLNSLTESLTAALEPMKALGELIPALDQLVLTLEGKESEKSQKLSPDDLVTSLADQLSAGLIDPWTFKCAYMAVYPADHPADLLHRLVELLGTQRLSGDLFRAAYEAVQAAEPPPRATTYSSGSGGEVIRTIPDEAIKAQLDALQRSNDELQRRQEDRERELSELLSQKERELQNAQDLLNQKLEELNVRYEDTASILTSREDDFRAALESKDMELIEKESELNMLRTQLEELRSGTEDMVKELQKEMQRLREDRERDKEALAAAATVAPPVPKPQTNFFEANAPTPPRGDLFPAGPAQPPKQLFDTSTQAGGFGSGDFTGGEGYVGGGGTPSNPQFQPAVTTQPLPAMQPGQPMMQPGQPAPQTVAPTGFGAPTAPTAFQPPQQPVFQPPQPAQPQPQPRPATPAPQPAPAPATTPLPGSGPGSYGSGVRAQVFEVIVRQALAGAPWREICAGPMQVNNITPDEVESEVKRRQAMLNK